MVSHPHSRFDLVFNSALDAYTKRTRQYLPSHPLLSSLQSCDSAEAVLAVLREQIPMFFRYSDDTFSMWLIPTVNVLHAFSANLGEGVGLVFSPAKVVFAGIGVLLSAAKDVSSSQDKLVDLFNRIGYFFHRLEIYTEIPPTPAMTDIIVEIMVEVLSILAMATNELKRGQLKKYLKKLTGNTEIEGAMQKLDELTQEEVRIASAELMKITHGMNSNVLRVDDTVKGVHDRVQGISNNVQDVGKKVQDVEDKVQGIDSNLDQLNRNQLRYSLLQWLSPPDPSINHNIARKIYHSGSAQWFFQGTIFKQWKSIGSVLWLHGNPGSGKSILCSSIIQDIIALRDAGSASLAYFYFDFRDIDKQKLHDLLPSLLIQLSARSDPCCDILFRLYFAHDRGVTKPSDETMVECLKEMLILETQNPVYIILDALDESPIMSNVPSPREELLRLVGELVGLNLPNLHICITSRPELDIRAVLEPLTQHPVSLHDESGQIQDIIDYITSFVHSDRMMRRWREEDKDLVIKTLSGKADEMFRWVFCQLDILRNCLPASVRRILDELPESLDKTYERILREIRKSNQGLAHRLLQCLVAAVRPLRVEELAEVLAFEFKAIGTPKLNPDWRWEDQEEAVLSVCSSLVVVVNHGHSCVVQFSHFSVQEFLTSRRLAESKSSSKDVSRYRVRLRPAHVTLAQACLGALLRLDDRIDEDSVKAFPLAPYAAEHWASHARFGNVVSSRLKGAMQCLFDADKPYFAAWLWIYNPDRSGRTFWPRPGRPDARPLYYAARLGFRDLVKHLLGTHPGDVNARGGWDGTALHAALSEGHVGVASVLLEHGADVNVQNVWEGTPLHHASKRGQLEIGRWLLDRGADVDARNGSNWTPLHLAATYGRHEFARMLLERGGAEVDARGDGRRSALHLAVANGRLEVVRVLLERGADIDARDVWERTPFELESVEPRKHRRQEILQLISEHAFFQLLSECGGASLAGE